ncbi:hypothetical protein [Rhizobium azibense]|uniref:Uncharacterized protein n=1 Tax=Rhizobium azibense TaxID=1136135 RepID=A0A4V2VDV8_9HYPH|nr:hypothetical protein [Rhizobium azibense]TCU34145.1 hypothetical protein EV129_113130 [Rhizobium azibense]
MTDQTKVLTEDRGAVELSSLTAAQGTKLFTIGASSITATRDWQGQLVRFTGECSVTIPADLPDDFSCGWSQDGADPVTFVAGAGATVQSVDGNLVSGGQYAIGGIAGMGAGVVRLYGQLTA